MTFGRCLCQAIRYEFSGEPTLVVHCHCDSCRRQTGSAMATFVIVPKAALRFTCGQPKEFASSAGVWRSFCGECGSALYYRTDKRPDVVDLYTGTVDDASALTTQGHVHAGATARCARGRAPSVVIPIAPAHPGDCFASLA